MTDYKAAFANAGTFAIAAASFIAGTFVLPNEFGNLERLLMIAAAVGVYAIGHITGQRFAGRSFSVDKRDLEHELEKANDNLARLADAEERAQTLQNLLGAERTLSSSYKEKLARAEERLKRYEQSDADSVRRAAAYAWVRDLDPREKVFLSNLRDSGKILTQPITEVECDAAFSSTGKALERTRVSGDAGVYRWRVSLNNFGRLAVEVGADLLEEAVEFSGEE